MFAAYAREWSFSGRAIEQANGDHDVDETRHRTVQRAGLIGGAVPALLAVAACAGHATKAEIPWWAVLAVAVSTVGLAGRTGAHTGRSHPEGREAEAPPRVR